MKEENTNNQRSKHRTSIQKQLSGDTISNLLQSSHQLNHSKIHSDHGDDHGHGHGAPRSVDMQGKWKPYPTSVALSSKIPALLLMTFVWIIAYIAVKSIKTPGHGHH